MKTRKNVKDLSPSEKAELVAAILTLKNSTPSRVGNSNRYDDYVSIHDQARGLAHNGPAFGPWHREFIRQFERDLQLASGNPDLRLPYWDWTTARGPGDAGWPFTADFMGGLGDSAADSRVTTGAFATDAADPSTTQFSLAVTDQETGDYLKRRGSAQEFPLPTQATTRTAMGVTPYDVVPYNSDPSLLSEAEFFAQSNGSFRKFLEWRLHNGPHPWVGRLSFDLATGLDIDPALVGSMTWQASPNDPVFFLHHCAVDRLWAIWQQRHGYPGYEPTSGASAGHDLGDTMGLFDDPSAWSVPVNATPESVVQHQAIGPWYDTDLPQLSLASSSIAFGDIPTDLTTYRPVQLSVLTPRIVQFRLVGFTGTGSFSAAEPVTVADPTVGDVAQPVDVYVKYVADGPIDAPQGGTAVLEAFIVDDEGYYGGIAGAEYLVASFPISFGARTVERPRAALTVVLDRSGSMGWAAGGGMTRHELLVEALEVLRDTMSANDGLGMVSYDDLVARVFDVEAMTPSAGHASLSAALVDGSLAPRNDTAIGAAMLEGADVLQDEATSPGTPYDRHAMIVMTDGNENVEPYVTDPLVTSAIAPFADRVFAIGLGRPQDVSETTLGAISTYMAITGDMNESERRFRLVKYFTQAVADATGMSIVIDPEGALLGGLIQTFDFDIADTELSFDVIVASPLAFALELWLTTPSGKVIERSSPGPNADYALNLVDTFFRVRLPALPGDPAGSHAGRWRAHLRIDERRLQTVLRGNLALTHRVQPNVSPTIVAELRAGTIRWFGFVQTRSNLRLEVDATRSGSLVGANLLLRARVLQYDVPIAERVTVVAEITGPSGTMWAVALVPDGAKTFRASVQALDAGLYTIRYRATGWTRAGHAFSREAVRTLGIYREEPPRPQSTGSGRDDRLCEILGCLLGDEGLREWLAKTGLDVPRLLACLRRACGRGQSRPPRKTKEASAVEALTMLRSVATELLRVQPLKPRAPAEPRMVRVPLDLPREFMPVLVDGEDGEAPDLVNRPLQKKMRAMREAMASKPPGEERD